MTMFERPLRATKHCRHYSYNLPITRDGSGPHCAKGILLDAGLNNPQAQAVGACMPGPQWSCPSREEYTDAEREAWQHSIEQRQDRLAAAISALPAPIPLRTQGVVKCPNCGGRLHYARWHRGAEIGCETEYCCGARFSIQAGKDWPLPKEQAR